MIWKFQVAPDISVDNLVPANFVLDVAGKFC